MNSNTGVTGLPAPTLHNATATHKHFILTEKVGKGADKCVTRERVVVRVRENGGGVQR